MSFRFKGKRLHTYIKAKKLRAGEVLLVADTTEEIQIAKQYNYRSCALSGGHQKVARLKKERPDFLIHNLKQIIPIIKSLSPKIN